MHVTVLIKKRIKLDATLGVTQRRPKEQREANVHHGRVEGKQFIFQSKPVFVSIYARHTHPTVWQRACERALQANCLVVGIHKDLRYGTLKVNIVYKKKYKNQSRMRERIYKNIIFVLKF